MSKHRRPAYLPIAIIAVVIIAIVAAVIMWFKPDSKPMTTQQPVSNTPASESESMLSTTQSSAQTKAPLAQNQALFVTGLERLPASLKGTQVDGEIIIDENKQLVVTEGLRRLFDYFLSALGEENEAVIATRVERYIRHHTPEPAASQAVAIFGNYVAYLKALPDIEKTLWQSATTGNQKWRAGFECYCSAKARCGQLTSAVF